MLKLCWDQFSCLAYENAGLVKDIPESGTVPF